MKRLLIAALVLVAAWFAGRAVWWAMAGDETRIRRLFATEAERFNDTAVLTVLDSFAPDWRDRTLGVDRATLRAALLWAFQNRRMPDGAFHYRVELPDEEFDVQVDGDGARARLPLRLYDRTAGEEPVWELRVDAELGRQDGAWRVLGSSHETLRGGPPR